MPRVAHVVVTGNFAGVERYVCDVAAETSRRGWDVTVVGGDPRHAPAELAGAVRWLPGSTPAQAVRSLVRAGRQDVCHVHMTYAEGAALVARPAHRAPILSTRHFAARRGASPAGRVLAPWIAARLAREVAVSEFVARRLERAPDAVILNGVGVSQSLWRRESRVVLVLQRLEPDKDTLTALRAWQASELAGAGWSLRITGTGAERASLEAFAAAKGIPNVTFAGWTARVAEEFAGAGILLAPGPADSFGFSVVEAMAAGIPVVASAAGGHLETVGRLPGAALFPAGDAAAAGAALRCMLSADVRAAAARAGRELVRESFTIARHVDRLLGEYEAAARGASRRAALAAEASAR